jgi:hypothetical protein
MFLKKKVGTVIDEELMLKAKQVALSQKQSLSQLLEDALRTYLLKLEKDKGERQKDVSKKTKGVMKVSPEVLSAVMEEEGIYDA